MLESRLPNVILIVSPDKTAEISLGKGACMDYAKP